MYADVIVDISHENLDKTYQYRIKPEEEAACTIGTLVHIPFGKGNRQIKGYVVGLSEQPNWDVDKIKELSVADKGVAIEGQLIQLAYWIKENYGATMNDALKTVIPVKKAVKNAERKYIHLRLSDEEAREFLELSKKKSNKGRVRLLEALLSDQVMDYQTAVQSLNIARTTIQDLEKLSVIEIEKEIIYRNPVHVTAKERGKVLLNDEQRKIVEQFEADYDNGVRTTYLLHGITGSGKTEVYMEMIDKVLREGKQVIMLIPEISLTYQTVLRFYKRFGNRISILNSRLSQGERYDQYMRAKSGKVDIMIGPRSALFTPFQNLGLVIIDEEHESSYKSEGTPKYHARETAIERARMSKASVVLGSATPSVESYKKALDGEYKLFTLKERAVKGSLLPTVHLVDLRVELKEKNRSIFSRQLKALIEDRLQKKEQIMLFINRRGYSGFVSCRSCGHVLKCPHCDISLTYHKTGKLACHYCGHEELIPKLCPACGSPYIAAFGTGTQKIEELTQKEFPNARILRMDADTTGNKDGHEKILSAFAEHKADILVGTQMIVKGHDFKEVTLVGILAADLSLYVGDYRSAERTFELLVQASGRAGRGERSGEVVIQTYTPEHYSIKTAAENDYLGFYEQEIAYRKMLSYPPEAHIMAVMISGRKEMVVEESALFLKEALETGFEITDEIKIIGPAKASIAKLNDIYRQVMYVKSKEYGNLVSVKDFLEGFSRYSERMKQVSVQFDFDPMSSY